MAETIRGKGVISGIAMGKIMLAGQNLDGYLVNYQPEAKETELQKAQAALTAVAEVLHESIERLKKQEMTEQMPVQPGAVSGLDGALDIKSSFFEAHLLAEVGDTRARLETFFQRGKDNKLVMLRRLNGGAE